MRSFVQVVSRPGVITALLTFLLFLTSGPAARAAEEADAVVPVAGNRPSFFWHVLASNGIIFGPLMLLISLSLALLILSMTLGLAAAKQSVAA